MGGVVCNSDSDKYRYLISVQNKYGIRALSSSELDWLGFYQSKRGNHQAAETYWGEANRRMMAIAKLGIRPVSKCSFFSASVYLGSKNAEKETEWEKRATGEKEAYAKMDEFVDKFLEGRRNQKKEEAKMDKFKTPTAF